MCRVPHLVLGGGEDFRPISKRASGPEEDSGKVPFPPLGQLLLSDFLVLFVLAPAALHDNGFLGHQKHGALCTADWTIQNCVG